MTDKTVQFKPRSYRTEIVSTDGTVLVSRRVIATSLAHAAAFAWDAPTHDVAKGGRVVKMGKTHDVTVNVTPEEE